MYRVIYRARITDDWITSSTFDYQKDVLVFKRRLSAKYRIAIVQWKDANGNWVG